MILFVIVVHCDHSEKTTENRVVVSYGVPTVLNSTGYGGNIHLSSQTLFNATLFFNDVQMGSCINSIDCWLNSPTVWSKKNQYKVIITAEDIKHSDETYFIIAYEWGNNCSNWVPLLEMLMFLVGLCFFIGLIALAFRVIFVHVNKSGATTQDIPMKDYESMGKCDPNLTV